jgi:hypothetical protein
MAKIRAIVNGVSYYTNTTAIKREKSSCHTMQNTALRFALDCMGKDLGIARNVHLYDHKMKKHSFDIQLCVV